MMALAAPLETADEPRVTADEPRVIARKYRLETLLSEGGMGSVWRAFNLQLEVPVAIKLLRPGLSGDELGERLRVEARAAAKLVHPSIVRIFDIGEAESGEPFIVMELLNGESLGDLLERGALPAINAVQLLLPIAEALSLAHSRGVIHRDLKPDNIFLAREGDSLQPKLLDFGIAKVTSTAATDRGVLTQTGTVLGSPNYMSPEQAYGRSDIDHRADIWSFCVVLHEAIAGCSLFSGTSVQDILRSVVQDDPLPLEVLAGVDRPLSDLVQSGLAKEREQRPSSIFELGQLLARWLVEQGVDDDATGASLEVKWLGRSTDTLLLNRPKAVSAPRAQHDQATLVSVLNPRPRPSTAPTLSARHRRGVRWLPAAVLVAAGLLSWLGWGSLRELRSATEVAVLPRLASQPVSPPAARVAAILPVVTVDALAVESAASPPAPRVAPLPQTSAAPARPALWRPGKQAPPPKPSRALAPRDPAAELMDPY